jgi:uncharacterized protein (UPF0335 family)
MKISELNDLQREYIDLVLHGKLEERTKEDNDRIKFLYNELRKRGLLTNTIRQIRQLRVGE